MIREISLDQCREGDIVAEDVILSGSRIPVIVRNTTVNDYVLYRLKSLNINRIYIKDEEPEAENKQTRFAEVYNENIDSMKKIFRGIAVGNKIDIKAISELTNSLVDNSSDISQVTVFMHRIRGLDDYTYSHSVNVALYSMLIGKWLKFDSSRIKNLVRAGLLHDVGKARVPAAILNKKGSLTEREFTEIKKHPVNGYKICKGIGWLDNDIINAVLMHHEREDGTGYPFGLAGNKINRFARITAVADVYDAITSERVYKPRQTPFETFRLMQSEFGRLDTGVTMTFLSNISSMYIGSDVLMNTGEVGRVVFISPQNIESVIVRVKDLYIDLSKNNEYKIVQML